VRAGVPNVKKAALLIIIILIKLPALSLILTKEITGSPSISSKNLFPHLHFILVDMPDGKNNFPTRAAPSSLSVSTVWRPLRSGSPTKIVAVEPDKKS
jgi:hypothetical protein